MLNTSDPGAQHPGKTAGNSTGNPEPAEYPNQFEGVDLAGACITDHTQA
jgi:hypothetical protein